LKHGIGICPADWLRPRVRSGLTLVAMSSISTVLTPKIDQLTALGERRFHAQFDPEVIHFSVDRNGNVPINQLATQFHNVKDNLK
jgi:hypothetical protein